MPREPVGSGHEGELTKALERLAVLMEVRGAASVVLPRASRPVRRVRCMIRIGLWRSYKEGKSWYCGSDWEKEERYMGGDLRVEFGGQLREGHCSKDKGRERELRVLCQMDKKML